MLSLRYLACNAHAPRCRLRPVQFYNIFPHYLINDTIFETKLLNMKFVYWFFTFTLNVFHSKKNWVRYDKPLCWLKNERPTWCRLLFYYFTSYVLNMFRTLIYPSSGVCDCIVELPHRSFCSQFVVCWRFGVHVAGSSLQHGHYTNLHRI